MDQSTDSTESALSEDSDAHCIIQVCGKYILITGGRIGGWRMVGEIFGFTRYLIDNTEYYYLNDYDYPFTLSAAEGSDGKTVFTFIDSTRRLVYEFIFSTDVVLQVLLCANRKTAQNTSRIYYIDGAPVISFIILNSSGKYELLHAENNVWVGVDEYDIIVFDDNFDIIRDYNVLDGDIVRKNVVADRPSRCFVIQFQHCSCRISHRNDLHDATVEHKTHRPSPQHTYIIGL